MRVCTLMSGSSGNATYIETDKVKMLVDAGQTGKKITQELEASCGVKAEELDCIVITHAHRDHVCGAGVLSRRYGLPLFATEGTWYEMEPLIGPIKAEYRIVIEAEKKWNLKDMEIEAFPTSHDALESIGVVCTSKKKSVGIATDSGVFTARMGSILRDLDCLIIESNHDTNMLYNGSYPWPLKKRISGILGHLSNENAGQALLKIMGGQTKHVILAHLSEENNRPALALETVKNMLASNHLCVKEVDITVAPRYNAGRCISV